MSIPTSANNVDLAYEFINFLMQAGVAARNSNYLAYPTAMSSAMPFVDQDVRDNPVVYPSDDTVARLETLSPLGGKTNRLMNRVWVKSVCASGKWCSVSMSAYY